MSPKKSYNKKITFNLTFRDVLKCWLFIFEILKTLLFSGIYFLRFVALQCCVYFFRPIASGIFHRWKKVIIGFDDLLLSWLFHRLLAGFFFEWYKFCIIDPGRSFSCFGWSFAVSRFLFEVGIWNILSTVLNDVMTHCLVENTF